MYLNY